MNVPVLPMPSQRQQQQQQQQQPTYTSGASSSSPGSFDPFPLFSPTQQPAGGGNVLRSIFSPPPPPPPPPARPPPPSRASTSTNEDAVPITARIGPRSGSAAAVSAALLASPAGNEAPSPPGVPSKQQAHAYAPSAAAKPAAAAEEYRNVANEGRDIVTTATTSSTAAAVRTSPDPLDLPSIPEDKEGTTTGGNGAPPPMGTRANHHRPDIANEEEAGRRTNRSRYDTSGLSDGNDNDNTRRSAHPADDADPAPPPPPPPRALTTTSGSQEVGDIPRSLSIGSLKQAGPEAAPLADGGGIAITAAAAAAAGLGGGRAYLPSPSNDVSSNASSPSSNLFLSPISVLTEGTKSIYSVIACCNDDNNPKPTTCCWNDSGGNNGNNLPIDMLDFDFVSRCSSATDLESIIAVLGRDSPPKYPSLLRIATARLRSVVTTGQPCAAVGGGAGGATDAKNHHRSDRHRCTGIPTVQVDPIAMAVKPDSFESAAAAAAEPVSSPLVLSNEGPKGGVRQQRQRQQQQLHVSSPTNSIAHPGKRVCFAPTMMAAATTTVGTPCSALAGVAIECNHDIECDDDDSLCMDISASPFGAGSTSTVLLDTSGAPPGRGRCDGFDLADALRGEATDERNERYVEAAARSSSHRRAAAAAENDDKFAPSKVTRPEPRCSSSFDGDQSSEEEEESSSRQLKENLASVLAEHSMLQSDLDSVVEERDSLKSRLSDQTAALRNLEEKIEEEKSAFAVQIAALEGAKVNAEKDVATLRGTVVTSSDKAREVTEQLKSREDEVAGLRDELQSTEGKRRREMKASCSLHDELLAEIEHLTRELNSQEEKTASALRALEERLSREFEEVLSQQRAKADELVVHLGKSREDVERLTKQKDQLSRSLWVVQKEVRSGFDVARREADRRKYEGHIASSEAAANAMAKALAISERELMAATERRDAFERQCSELIETNSRLRQENNVLSERIQLLNEELSSSHYYIDTLCEEVEALKVKKKAVSDDAAEKLRKKLCNVEKGYRDEIRQLKSQLKESKSWVPIDLYKNAVKEARSNAAALSKKEEELVKLRKFVEKEASRTKKEKTTFVSRKQASMGKSIRSLGKIAAEKNKTTMSDENQTPNFPRHVSPSTTPKTPVSPPEETAPVGGPPIRGKSLARLKAVREAGGRSGLSAKLKKARGQISPQQQVESSASKKQQGGAENFRLY